MTPDGPFLPPVTGPWQALTAEESLAFVQRLDAHLRAAGLAEPPFSRQCPVQAVHAVPLSFYPGWLLLTAQVLLGSEETACVDVLLGPGFIWCMDGTSPMLHAINAGQVPLSPASGEGVPAGPPWMASPLAPLVPRVTGPDYLRFFCHAVRGEHGSFRVVQTAQDLRDCGVAPGDVERLAALLKPLRAAWRRGEAPRRIRVATPILYGGELFQASFDVEPTGMVTMVADKALASAVAPPERMRHWLRSIRPLALAADAPGHPA